MMDKGLNFTFKIESFNEKLLIDMFYLSYLDTLIVKTLNKTANNSTKN
jgi:hypothetical protein